MIDGWLNSISGAMAQNPWLAPVLALVAGVLTSFTPCSLSTIPLVVGYVGGAGGGGQNTGRALRLSLTFALGTAVTFTALGTAASLLGRLFRGASSWWYIVLGVLMVLMALQTWEVFNFIPATNLISKSTRRSYVGAFIAGLLGGVFSSPCATPVLIALLALVAGQGSVAWGVLLLLLYSVGHGALAVVAGTSTGFVQKLMRSEKYGRFSQVLKIVLGTAILLMGLYMFWLGF